MSAIAGRNSKTDEKIGHESSTRYEVATETTDHGNCCRRAEWALVRPCGGYVMLNQNVESLHSTYVLKELL